MKELEVTVEDIMHWREMMSRKSSDTKFLSKCHSGKERQVGAPFSFMLYWKDIIKLAYRAGTVCAGPY